MATSPASTAGERGQRSGGWRGKPLSPPGGRCLLAAASWGLAAAPPPPSPPPHAVCAAGSRCSRAAKPPLGRHAGACPSSPLRLFVASAPAPCTPRASLQSETSSLDVCSGSLCGSPLGPRRQLPPLQHTHGTCVRACPAACRGRLQVTAPPRCSTSGLGGHFGIPHHPLSAAPRLAAPSATAARQCGAPTARGA